MKTLKQLDPKHKEVNNMLRVIGPIVAAAGLLFMLAGFIDFFTCDGMPQYFWCFFVGMPIFFVGSVLSKFGYMGSITRYMAGEMAPVAKDTFNYMADGTQEGVKTLAKAVGEGLSSGSGAAATVILCHKCNAENDKDAKFCSQCGAPIQKSKPCPQCAELNDPDAKFCDNCGRAFG